MENRVRLCAVRVVLMVGLAATAAAGEDYVEAIQPKGELPEERLLDVAIGLFDPGLGDVDPQGLAKKGLRAAVRKAEARYVAIQLRNTLQSTGQWGAVRVVPGHVPAAELSVGGSILKSNGKDLELDVRAKDSTGRVWLDKIYKQRADLLAYSKDRLGALDPFQSLYNRIANDLVRARDKRSPRELALAREVASLLFAADLAPDPFASYLWTDRKGRETPKRLPAVDDPMLARIAGIRDRDQMFVDTLNEYYGDFYARMDKPYDDWRAYSYQEQVAYDSLHRASLIKKIVGAVAVAIGVFAINPENDHGAKDVLILGGIAAVQSGFEDGKESGIHKAALMELADSFEGDVTPLLVDIDGKIVQLKGSAEAQYAQWRELLRELAATDAALPEDINVLPAPVVVSAEAPAPSAQP